MTRLRSNHGASNVAHNRFSRPEGIFGRLGGMIMERATEPYACLGRRLAGDPGKTMTHLKSGFGLE